MSLPTFDAEPSYQQIWEAVWERLRTAILTGELASGTKLVEAELANQFRVSRGPVREALRELSREGLVMDVPRRGTFVCTMTQTDLVEVYSIRSALEVRAIRDGVEHATAVELRAIAEAYKVMDAAWSRVAESEWENSIWTEAISADNVFHRSVIALAKNNRMDTIYGQMASQTMLLLVTAAEADHSLRLAPLGQVHGAIAEAIAGRDVKAACAAVEEHYDYTRSRLFTSRTAPAEQRQTRKKS
jgi:DNA-binding GntR family transcriptional regulator